MCQGMLRLWCALVPIRRCGCGCACSMQAAFAAGVSPEVVHYDPTQGTMLTRYVPNSRTLTNEDLHNPVMLQEIAHLLSRFHHGVA